MHCGTGPPRCKDESRAYVVFPAQRKRMHLNALTQHFAAPGWLGIAALFVCAGLAIAAARRQSSTGEKLAIVLRAVALALIAVALAGTLNWSSPSTHRPASHLLRKSVHAHSSIACWLKNPSSSE